MEEVYDGLKQEIPKLREILQIFQAYNGKHIKPEYTLTKGLLEKESLNNLYHFKDIVKALE